MYKFYNILRCYRLNRGEVVAICIKFNSSYELKSTLCCDNGTFECLSSDVHPNTTRCIRFIFIYRAPRSSTGPMDVLLITLRIPYPTIQRLILPS